MWKFKISKRNDDSSRKLALEGNCVLTPVYPISENLEKTEKQLGKLKEANFKRIELSNSIRVKNNLSEQDTDKFLSLTRTKLENKNYNMDNVIVYNDVKEAYNFIRGIKTKDEVYALFENDLPDTYNEKERG